MIGVILMAENREVKPPERNFKMFRFRFINTKSEYERHDMLRENHDSFNKVRSYEIGNLKRLDLSE